MRIMVPILTAEFYTYAITILRLHASAEFLHKLCKRCMPSNVEYAHAAAKILC